MTTETTPETEMKTLAADLKKATDEVKKFAETATTEMKNLGKLTEETKASADKALTDMNAMSARLLEVEQKMVRGGPAAQPTQMKSMGQMVLDNEGLKAWLADSPKGKFNVKLDIDMKTIANLTSGTTTVGSTASVSTSLVVPDRQPMVSLVPDRRMTVRDLLTPGSTSSGNIEYPVETAQQNEAATVAEAANKPQSDMTFDLRNAPVRTIATYVKASRQILDDAPQLQSYIDGRLRYFLMYTEELQLLNGDGTGVNILGIIPQASAYSAAFSMSDTTNIDILRLASLQATLALYPSTGYVLHPTDWAKIELTKDGVGRYIVGNPVTTGIKQLWGLPVVDTQAITAGTFLTGAFKLGAQIFDRMGVEVLISTEDASNFTTNMVTIRGEERLALAVYRPAAFVTGSLT